MIAHIIAWTILGIVAEALFLAWVVKQVSPMGLSGRDALWIWGTINGVAAASSIAVVAIGVVAH